MHAAADRRPVAACLAGQVRTFVRADVRRNIYAAMIRPIAAEVDVFVSFSFEHSRWNVKVGVDEVRHMLQMFDVGSSAFDQRQAGSLNAVTSHTPCLNLVRNREIARCHRYSWILRLRSDVVYTGVLPPFDSWPMPSSPTVYTSACRAGPLFFEEERALQKCMRRPPRPAVRECYAWRRWSGRSLGVPAATRTRLPVTIAAELLLKSRATSGPSDAIELERIYKCKHRLGAIVEALGAKAETRRRSFFELVGVRNHTGGLGCAKDTWGLMTRAAADAYFNRTLLEAAASSAGARGSPCSTPGMWASEGIVECLLGCVLHAQRVIVRPVLDTTDRRTRASSPKDASASQPPWLHRVRMSACTVRTANCTTGFSVGAPTWWKVLQLPT